MVGISLEPSFHPYKQNPVRHNKRAAPALTSRRVPAAPRMQRIASLTEAIMRPRLVASNYPTVCLTGLNASHWALRIRCLITTDRLGRAGITGLIQNRQGFPGKKAKSLPKPLPCLQCMARYGTQRDDFKGHGRYPAKKKGARRPLSQLDAVSRYSAGESDAAGIASGAGMATVSA